MKGFSGALKLCVLASGEGSNLKAILKARNSGKIKSRVALVISNNSRAGALAIAEKNAIPAVHLSIKQFKSEKDFIKSFLSLLSAHKIDLIILAGYLKMLSPLIVKKYHNRILNIHPALLPDFGGEGMYGLNVHKAVISSGRKTSGATVHLVDEAYDSGEVILQKEVKVDSSDTAESLQEKILKVEHRLYPEAIKLFEENKINIVRAKTK